MITRRNFIAASGVCVAANPLFLFANQSKPVPVEKYEGNILMVDFWASWCIPCKRSFPWLNKINQTYKQSGLSVLGVNLDENREDADEFLNKVPAEFEIIFDPQGQHASYYELKAMPSSFIFDREGKLVAQHSGFKSEKIPEYEQKLKSLL